MFFKKPMDLPTADTALPGRAIALPTEIGRAHV
jgi:hypothetical protein